LIHDRERTTGRKCEGLAVVQTALRGQMKRRKFITLFGGAVVALKT
jgi:hypothetical protein